MTNEEVHVLVSEFNLSYQKAQVVVYDSEFEWCERADRPAEEGRPRGLLGRTLGVGPEGDVVAVLMIEGSACAWPVRVFAAAAPAEVASTISEVMAF